MTPQQSVDTSEDSAVPGAAESSRPDGAGAPDDQPDLIQMHVDEKEQEQKEEDEGPERPNGQGDKENTRVVGGDANSAKRPSLTAAQKRQAFGRKSSTLTETLAKQLDFDLGFSSSGSEAEVGEAGDRGELLDVLYKRITRRMRREEP